MAEFTPVTPRSGGLVHATSLTDAHKTACGRVASGWKVALQTLTCLKCKELIFYDVRSPSKR